MSDPFINTECIHCGCDEWNACIAKGGKTCKWLAVNHELGIGVCTHCPDSLDDYREQERTLSENLSEASTT